MGATQTDQRSALGKWNFITVSILGVVLIIALIWSLSRALNNSSPHGSIAPANEDTTMNTVPAQEEIERQHGMAEQRTAPAIQTPVAPESTVIPINQKNNEVILQKAKAKVNQRVVEIMKQYIRDNPNLDTWDIKEQIKKRENQGAQTQ